MLHCLSALSLYDPKVFATIVINNVLFFTVLFFMVKLLGKFRFVFQNLASIFSTLSAHIITIIVIFIDIIFIDIFLKLINDDVVRLL